MTGHIWKYRNPQAYSFSEFRPKILWLTSASATTSGNSAIRISIISDWNIGSVRAMMAAPDAQLRRCLVRLDSVARFTRFAVSEDRAAKPFQPSRTAALVTLLRMICAALCPPL